jgi:hypothetical protein
MSLMSSNPSSESAVEAFWKSFSPRREHKQTASLGPRRAKTNNLPVELLMMIFKLVYEQEKRGMDLLWPQSTILSPSLFPFAIAAVCSLWREAMSLIPEVWTRFVIIVDSRPAISPSAILSQLSWSRSLPLNVVVTRMDFNHTADSQHERMQVTSTMNILINPHMHRFQKLDFDVMFSSSLPPFPDGFHGLASILQDLFLECREDNGRSADDWESVTSTEQQYPALAQLIIDGRNYYNGCKGDPHFAAKFKEIWYLAISHYKPLPGESFLASDFLRPIAMIKHLRFLDMTDLILDPSPLPLSTSTGPPRLTQLLLKDIHNSQSLTEIFGAFTDVLDINLVHSAT